MAAKMHSRIALFWKRLVGFRMHLKSQDSKVDCNFGAIPTNAETDAASSSAPQVSSEEPPVEDSRCSKPSCSTLLILFLMFLVFVLLPAVYMLHCVDLLRGRPHISELEHIRTDHVHARPNGRPPETKSDIRPKGTSFSHPESLEESPCYPSTLPSPPPATSGQCEVIPEELRFDCHPQSGASQTACEERGCCWLPPQQMQDVPKLGVPYCFYPVPYKGYQYVNVTEEPFGWSASMQRTFRSCYPSDIPVLQMEVRFESDTRLRVKIFDLQRERFEVPIPKVPDTSHAPPQRIYNFILDKSRVGFQVARKSGEVVFDSQDIGGFTFADQFLQLSALLPSSYIYGLGEHRSTLMHDTNWKQYTIFNHDHVPEEKINLYGSHPFYLVMEDSGKSHGVFLLNSNAMDVILQPAPAITFRTIGGILDFYFFLGPTPQDVVAQFTDLIGRPEMPPYWGLGFHLCRFNYGSLNKTKEVWQRTRAAGIPFDAQWNDIDYMDNSKDFTYDKNKYAGLPDFVREVHRSGMHYVPLIDAGISAAETPGTYLPYDEGVQMDIFVKNASGLLFIGKVWNPVATVWPDFTHPSAAEYWTKQLQRFHDEVQFDGAWIDMNEPSNFYSGAIDVGCPSSSALDHPPYLPSVHGNELFYRTICMSARQHAGRHYDVHNVYALSEAAVTHFALKELLGKRPFIISRSTFSGHGHYGGHWTGDNAATWYDMKKSIAGILNFNMFGVPLVGADICGFRGNTSVNLCERWMQLGSFYPFSRNHNDDKSIDQDPVALGPKVVATAKKALEIRYSLLPYIYTLFWKAHAFGETVARPLFFEFPHDKATYTNDVQFLWGSGLMVIPVLEEGKTQVAAYLPADVWYDFYTFESIRSDGIIRMLPAPSDTIPLLIRGGTVLPRQYPRQTTILSRKSKFELMVALNASSAAGGQLYWDDGESLESWELDRFNLLNITVEDGELRSVVDTWNYPDPHLVLDSVTIMGVTKPVRAVTVNAVPKSFAYSTTKKVLIVPDLDLPLGKPFTMIWA